MVEGLSSIFTGLPRIEAKAGFGVLCAAGTGSGAIASETGGAVPVAATGTVVVVLAGEVQVAAADAAPVGARVDGAPVGARVDSWDSMADDRDPKNDSAVAPAGSCVVLVDNSQNIGKWDGRLFSIAFVDGGG